MGVWKDNHGLKSHKGRAKNQKSPSERQKKIQYEIEQYSNIQKQQTLMIPVNMFTNETTMTPDLQWEAQAVSRIQSP